MQDFFFLSLRPNNKWFYKVYGESLSRQVSNGTKTSLWNFFFPSSHPVYDHRGLRNRNVGVMIDVNIKIQLSQLEARWRT
jgi:hypothetical protein